MSSEEAQKLMSAAVGGSEEALVRLLEHFGPRVRARLNGKIASKWQSVLEIDDVMQVSYAEAFLQIRSFKPAGDRSFLDWLTRVAENNLRDAVKQLGRAKRPPPGRRIKKIGSGASAVSLIGMLGGSGTTPSSAAHGEEVDRLLRDTLKRLPPEYAKVVELYDLEELPAKEVARQLGRSEGAMYMLRARAHDRLRSVLGGESRFFSDVS